MFVNLQEKARGQYSLKCTNFTPSKGKWKELGYFIKENKSEITTTYKVPQVFFITARNSTHIAQAWRN